VERFVFLVHQDHPAGDGRAGVHGTLCQDVEGLLGWQVEGQVGGDAREGRHALLEEALRPRPLGDVVGYDA
jgi:hypothetical protein